METIAHDAGYSRAALYRQFPNRESLDAALIQRTTQRHMLRLLERHESAGPVDMIVDTLVIVATELAHDPLLKTIAEAADEGTVAQMLANSSTVTALAEPRIKLVENALVADGIPAERIVRASETTDGLNVKSDPTGAQRVEIRLVDRRVKPTS